MCFAPMIYPGQQVEINKCTIQSIFGYFGNDFSKFEEEYIDKNSGLTINYLNTLDECLQ